MAGSAVVHVGVLVALAFLAVPNRSAAPDQTPHVFLMDTVVPDFQRLNAPSEIVDVAAGLAPGPANDGFLADDTPGGMTQIAQIAKSRRLDLGGRSLSPHVLTGNVSLTPGRGAGAGSGVGDGVGGGGGGGFFSLHPEGQKVVFVVDASRSMNHPHPGPGKTRFGRVKLELLNTISRMTEDQKFFMVFFNNVAIPMPADRMQEATPAACRRQLEWMAYLKAEGETHPDQALLLALSLQPDVIYFLTDGNFDARVVSLVTKSNRARSVVHTIGFGDNQGEALLKEIAVQNGGIYRFIRQDESLPSEPIGAVQGGKALSGADPSEL